MVFSENRKTLWHREALAPRWDLTSPTLPHYVLGNWRGAARIGHERLPGALVRQICRAAFSGSAASSRYSSVIEPFLTVSLENLENPMSRFGVVLARFLGFTTPQKFTPWGTAAILD